MAGFEQASHCRLYHDHEVIEDTEDPLVTRRQIWKRHFAYVEQTPRLFPHMTLFDFLLRINAEDSFLPSEALLHFLDWSHSFGLEPTCLRCYAGKQAIRVSPTRNTFIAPTVSALA